MLQNLNITYFNQAEPTSNTEKKPKTLIIDCFFVWDYGTVNDVEGKNVGTKIFDDFGRFVFEDKGRP